MILVIIFIIIISFYMQLRQNFRARFSKIDEHVIDVAFIHDSDVLSA